MRNFSNLRRYVHMHKIYLFSRILIPSHTFGGLLISLLKKLTQ
jgi:hypothetical protein